mmetsp:Transcript_88030/g.174699  ORF Transcript_88030/g.174699 Transcript_88030/m.174699 type:complete len:93 (+) Transcript_88030:997-1275(+)
MLHGAPSPAIKLAHGFGNDLIKEKCAPLTLLRLRDNNFCKLLNGSTVTRSNEVLHQGLALDALQMTAMQKPELSCGQNHPGAVAVNTLLAER